MRLYLDDDSVHGELVLLLKQAGHDVRLPAEVGMAGADDADHLRQAVLEARILLTRNYRDFEALHRLVLQVGGHHPGIFVIRYDQPTKRRLRPRDITRAIANFLAAAVPVTDQYIVLNLWQ